MAYLEGCPETAELARMLCARPRPDVEICEAARQVPCVPDLLSMSDATIKMLWERNSREASARGTWMHLEFEMLLNGHAVSAMSSEIKLFSKFLQQMKSGTAFRTEWAIFATEENLAGSIDFVALEPDGSLSLYDWKRTRCMLDKFNSFGKSMGYPLEHLPDATMWHYRLQLNVYKRILEKYYNATVSGMYVVGCHPDNGAQPFVDKVPFMETEANLLLEFQRQLALDARGGSSTAEANWPAWRQLLHSCMIPKVGPELYNRVSLQCKYYEEQVQPVMSVLRMRPALFFIIPSPLQTTQQLANWRFQLSATCWFLQLLRDKKVSLLEFGLFVFYKELVDVYPFMPDLIFASRVATSYEIWATCISSCLLLLHVLSGPIPSRRTLSARKAALSWIQSFGPQAMPHSTFLRPDVPVKIGGLESRLYQDVLGGADLDMSQASLQVEEDSQMAQPSTSNRRSEFPADVQVKREDEAEGEEGNEDDPLLSNVKKRRLMKGACATMSDFEGMFRQYEDAAQHDLGAVGKDRQDKDSCSILSRVKDLRELVQHQYPGWSEHLIRLGAAALSAYRARLSERIFVGDSAFFLWLLEGDRFIRVHEGFCYIYNDNGAFLPYTGIPPQAVLLRVANFFGQLEGMFRRLDPATVREDAAILSAISVDLSRFPREGLYLDACQEAAIWQKSAPNVDFDADDVDEEPVAGNDGKPGVSWNLSLAKKNWKLCQCIRNEMMHDKLISLLVEWCETGNARRPCVSFVDTCVQYDISRETFLIHVKKSALNDCYVYIPHPLLDPVLAQHSERLQKFYSQTFWANNDVFQCCLAAMALAKRGFNVDRCFIGESPGGVGQSLFSLHLDAMLGPNHGYFDPNVWYNEDELRKQIESFARCIVITGQEAPESHKKLHLDLFKKTMSGDGIAGRKPYGYTTRMFSIVGWKRLEVNRMMVFAGITQANFQSVMRRSLVWKPKARFHPDAVLKQAHADHELDGHFLADPSLKQFLISAPACAAGLRIQHAFELQHSQTDCVQIIDDYATGGDDFLTEDKMRKACGLSIRVRHTETAAGGAGLLQVSDSQEERDEEEAQYQALRDFIVQHLLEKGLSDITFWEFKRLECSQKPNAATQTIFQQLEKRHLMQKGCRKGKAKDVLQPILECKKEFKDLISTAQLDCEEQFLESMNAEQIQHYLHSNECRANNVETWKQFLESEIAKEKSKRGRPSPDDAVRRQQLQDRLRKAESYEHTCSHLSKVAGSGSAASSQSPARRLRVKGNPLAVNPALDAGSAYLVSYHYSDNRKVRCRRYVHGFGAQKCARRVQTQLYSHTADLDIENCCVILVLQILEKLCPKPEINPEALEALQLWSADRGKVCREELKVPEIEGKKLVTAVLSGGAPSKEHKDSAFLQKIQKASIYLRWLACSVLRDDYLELELRGDKPYPGATAFFYMWAAVEDYILEKWCAFIKSHSPKHLSLHFDGVRVNKDIVSDMDVFISDCQSNIKASTGFAVTIRQKNHAHFLQLLTDMVQEVTHLSDVPDILVASPNCILCAVWHLSEPDTKAHVLQAVSDIESPHRAYAQERKHRTYKQCSDLLTLNLVPRAGLPCSAEGRFLLHIENNGSPHALAVQMGGGAALVTDHVKQFKLTTDLLQAILAQATDSSTAVSFELCAAAPPDPSPSVLLDLQAGSAEDGWGHVSDEEAVVPDSKFIIDDQGMVVFQDVLRGSVEEEVASFMAEIKAGNIRRMDGYYRCTLCPFRSFHRLCQLHDHVRKHHVESNQFVCSGTKQIKVILALHDADCAQREEGSDYLWRSSVVLQKHVEPQLCRCKNLIDKSIRLLLTSSGPIYVNKAAIGDSLAAKRVLNIYYDLSFAEMLLREIVLHHSNVAFLSDSVVLYLFSLLPPASQNMSGQILLCSTPNSMWSTNVASHAITCFAFRLPAYGPVSIYAPWNLAICSAICIQPTRGIGGP